MLGRGVDRFLSLFYSYKQSHPVVVEKVLVPEPFIWGNVLPYFNDASLRIINLETSITEHIKKWPGKSYNYKMKPENARCLTEAKIDYCSLANNHILDYDYFGMEDTTRVLDSLNIKWSGVGGNIEEAMKPAILKFDGYSMACFSFSDHPENWKVKDHVAGINFLNTNSFDNNEMNKIAAEIAKVRNNVDFVSVSIHWGPNYEWKPTNVIQQIAHFLIDNSDVDLIHGHSSHHIQGIEIYKKKVIAYGCGDFIDDYALSDEYRNDLGFIYLLTINEDKKSWNKLELIPTKIHHTIEQNILAPQVNVAKGKDSVWLYKTMSELCQDFNTPIKKMNDSLFEIYVGH
jgi:poly-gamma-glutamate capsule biosynthesis protein CapA/YwtB (metallophosphatase superfamily)